MTISLVFAWALISGVIVIGLLLVAAVVLLFRSAPNASSADG